MKIRRKNPVEVSNEYIPSCILVNSIGPYYYKNLYIMSKLQPLNEWGNIDDLSYDIQVESSNRSAEPGMSHQGYP